MKRLAAAGCLFLLLLFLGAAAGAGLIALAFREDAQARRPPLLSPYPDGKDFALAIVDDAAVSTVEHLEPMYALLDRLGIRVTKNVWVFDPSPAARALFQNNGDSLDRTTYVRGPLTDAIDTLAEFPEMPWHDPTRPHVRYWFPSSNGEDAERFVRLLARENVLRLARERGTSIVYTHLAKWFLVARDGAWGIRRDAEEALRFLASLDGWFVPAGEVLDRLVAMRDVFVAAAEDRILIANRGAAVSGLTLLVRPGAEFILREFDPPAAKPVYWRDANRLRFILDIGHFARAARSRAMAVAMAAIAAIAVVAALVAAAGRILGRRRRAHLVIPRPDE